MRLHNNCTFAVRRLYLAIAVLGFSGFILPVSASWEPSRNAQGQVVTNAVGTATTFDYERSNQQILTGFSVGHDIPTSTNHLFYNMEQY